MIVVPPQALGATPCICSSRGSTACRATASRQRSGRLDLIFNVPGTTRFVALATLGRNAEVRVIDRTVNATQRGAIPGIDFQDAAVWRASHEAIWIQVLNANHPGLVRLPFDAKSGPPPACDRHRYFGRMTGFDVTADGSSVIMDEDAAEYEIWVYERDRRAARTLRAEGSRVAILGRAHRPDLL